MKRIRLEPEAYRQGHCFSITLATAGQAGVFQDSKAIGICLAALKQAATKYEAAVYAYCFMPDHLHLLAATPYDVSLVNFIQHFKQLSAFRLSLPSSTSQELWQPRFYDHALRSDEDVISVARYIFGNPVRAGIVANAADYPYSGSLVWRDALCSSGSEDPDLHLNRVPDAPSGRASAGSSMKERM